MTRRDYILLASALSSVKPMPNYDTPQLDQWENDCRAIASALGRENGRFDQQRFLRACGIDSVN